ncbi:DNA cytosine methyltransferase [Metapseudomonas boanensis]|uniref:DNA cytosine methyltransferase n=1 Tax=Metapseudomonas boanensis TaxID=2822138 RepID=UPI0032E8CCEE
MYWTPKGVRRTTPREWERCQGLPDDYTLPPGAASLRRNARTARATSVIGNSKAIPAVRWIGRRIQRQLDC